MWVLFWDLVLNAVLRDFSRAKEERVGCFTLTVFLLSCVSYRTLSFLRGTISRPVVCDWHSLV